MLLKRKLSKELFDGLEEPMKGIYKVNPGNANEYILDVEPDADNGALLRAKATEKARADAAEAKIAELTTELEDLQTKLTAAQSAGRPEVAQLEAQYKAKEQALKDKHKAELAAKDTQLATVLVDQKALELAAQISTTPELLVDIIKRRLKPNLTGDAPTTEVLDANGLASTMTIEDLGKEFIANPKYGAIIIGSNGSGGGARPPNGGGGGALRNGKKFDELTEAERVAWHREDAKGFQAASDANTAKKTGAL